MARNQNVFFKATLFVVGLLIGVLGGVFGTLIYLKVPFKLPDLPDGTFIATLVLTAATIQLARTTTKYAETTESILNEQRNANETTDLILDEQSKSVKRDRLSKEMDLLVVPLKNRIGTDVFFRFPIIAGEPEADRNNRNEFINEIKKYTYLDTTGKLRLAINNHLKSILERDADSFQNSKKELYEAIRTRYSEITTELKRLE